MTEHVTAVMVHAFANGVNGIGLEYQEHTNDPEDTAGWNVWLRLDPPGEPFTMDPEFDADFPTRRAAMIYAEALAQHFNTEIDEY